MRYVIYGLPCAGKDYLLSRMPFLQHIKGSEWLNTQSDNRFRELSKEEQNDLRRQFIRYVNGIGTGNVIVDGHYAFPEGGGYRQAFTDSDGDCYDVFVYLDTPVDIIHERIQSSDKNAIYSHLTISELQAWRDHEVSELFGEVLKRGKEFILLDDDVESIIRFMKGLADGSVLTAPQVSRMNADKVINAASGKRRIVLSDGDKTLTVEDLT